MWGDSGRKEPRMSKLEGGTFYKELANSLANLPPAPAVLSSQGFQVLCSSRKTWLMQAPDGTMLYSGEETQKLSLGSKCQTPTAKQQLSRAPMRGQIPCAPSSAERRISSLPWGRAAARGWPDARWCVCSSGRQCSCNAEEGGRSHADPSSAGWEGAVSLSPLVTVSTEAFPTASHLWTSGLTPYTGDAEADRQTQNLGHFTGRLAGLITSKFSNFIYIQVF